VTSSYTVTGVNSYGQGGPVSLQVQVVPNLQKNLPGGYVWYNNQAWAPAAPAAANWTYDNAANYCSTTALNGQSGWRLPSLSELKALLNSGLTPPASTGPYAWTSTPYSTTGQYLVDLGTHIVYQAAATPQAAPALCVR
jgi:hypothetical protein